VQVGPDGEVRTSSRPAGFKMSAKNAIDVILFTRSSFASVRLALGDDLHNNSVRGSTGATQFSGDGGDPFIAVV
jgi:hypothetical protein